jgi:hypothetical protein
VTRRTAEPHPLEYRVEHVDDVGVLGDGVDDGQLRPISGVGPVIGVVGPVGEGVEANGLALDVADVVGIHQVPLDLAKHARRPHQLLLLLLVVAGIGDRIVEARHVHIQVGPFDPPHGFRTQVAEVHRAAEVLNVHLEVLEVVGLDPLR